MSAAPINYDVIDTEVRSLVRAMNSIPGVQTEFSCAGHWDEMAKRSNCVRGYVLFTVSDQHLAAMLDEEIGKHFLRKHAGEDASHWERRVVLIQQARIVFAPFEGRARFMLEMLGSPMEAQREVIEFATKMMQGLASRQESAA